MNAHQKMAYIMVVESMSEIISANENTLLDYDENSAEYKDAKEFLSHDREYLANVIYNDVMQACDKTHEKHLRFAGEKFIKERIEKRLIKMGY